MSNISRLLDKEKRDGKKENTKPIFMNADVVQELKEWCAEHQYTMKEIGEALLQDFLNEQRLVKK